MGLAGPPSATVCCNQETMVTATIRSLAEFRPQHDWFIGVDSDGTVFDTMGIKHKECFIPTIIEVWKLESVARYVRETAEFINLYSTWRGIDRWRGLVMTFDLLRARGVAVSEMPHLRAFVADDAFPKSDAGLLAYKTAHPAPDLDAASEWSRRVNALFTERTRHIKPFRYVRESFEFLSRQADLMVVSSMPLNDVEHEWSENDLVQYTSLLGAQELGSKKVQLQRATLGKYPADHVLMIGDAPGDMQAAHANGALFYPINPGDEEASWRQFYEEGMRKFFMGEFARNYAESLIEKFEALLPEIPPWGKK